MCIYICVKHHICGLSERARFLTHIIGNEMLIYLKMYAFWYDTDTSYLSYTLLHYCWPKKCYVYYPHYSNYFLIVHPVFSCLTAGKINDWKVSNLRLSFVLPCDRCGYDCIPYRHRKPRYLAPVPKRPNPLTGGFSLLHVEWVDKQWIVQNFFTFNLVLLHACDNLLPVASPKKELF